MGHNLVVCMGDDIIFSNYLRKQNDGITKVSLQKMLRVSNKDFYIPIRTSSLCPLLQVEESDILTRLVKDDLAAPGPIATIISSGVIYEISSNKDSMFSPVVSDLDGFYVRSDGSELESAATAAALIYKNPINVYKEAFKALDLTVLPSYVGSVKRISEGIKKFTELDISYALVKACKYPEPEEKIELEKIMKESLYLRSNILETLGLEELFPIMDK